MLIFLVNLFLTIVIEVVANKILFKKQSFAPSTNRVVIANVISNPLAQIAHRVFFINLWGVELVVILFESLFYFTKKDKFSKALTVSLFLNLTSILIGIWIQSLQIAI